MVQLPLQRKAIIPPEPSKAFPALAMTLESTVKVLKFSIWTICTLLLPVKNADVGSEFSLTYEPDLLVIVLKQYSPVDMFQSITSSPALSAPYFPAIWLEIAYPDDVLMLPQKIAVELMTPEVCKVASPSLPSPKPPSALTLQTACVGSEGRVSVNESLKVNSSISP